jgi:hypothetical protein
VPHLHRTEDVKQRRVCVLRAREPVQRSGPEPGLMNELGEKLASKLEHAGEVRFNALLISFQTRIGTMVGVNSRS